MAKPRDTKRACTGCSREFECRLNNALCDICERRIQAARGEIITANFPTQQDLDKLQKYMKNLFKMKPELTSAAKDRKCKVCGAEIDKGTGSGLCASCFYEAGGICKMPGCDNKISYINKSGYCVSCLRLVSIRKKRCINIHAPIKRRRRI